MKATFTLFLIFLLSLGNSFGAHLSSNLQITARCEGGNEVPAVSVDAYGLAVITIDKSLQSGELIFQASGLSGDITGIHIHEGLSGENGPVVLNLTPFLDGTRLKVQVRSQGDFTMTNLLKGSYYLNVHTAANPGGEIRGQLKIEADRLYGTPLTGNNIVPPILGAQASGFANLSISSSGERGFITASFSGLSGAVTVAHLHGGMAGTNGGVLVDLSAFINADGTLMAEIDPALIMDSLATGSVYLNVHTALNPGGEIRGNFVPVSGLAFDCLLNGDQQVPAVATSASGVVQMTYTFDTGMLEVNGFVNAAGETITAAHLHAGGLGSNGGVVVDMSGIVTDSIFSGQVQVSNRLLQSMLSGGIYLNVHTTTNPSGEIRGQVYRLAREGYLCEFGGGQEVPPVAVSGSGVGMVSIDRDQSNAHYMMVIDGLEGTFAAAHFHDGGPGENGGVLFNLSTSFVDSIAAFGYWMDLGADAAKFRTTGIYANVHSSVHPSGELRGNFVRGSKFASVDEFDPQFNGQLLFTGRMSGNNESSPVITDATGVIGILLSADMQNAWINLSVNGLSSPFAGVHLHTGVPGEDGPVVLDLTRQYYKNRISYQWTNIDPQMIMALMEGNIYANLHTRENPGGELRAQVVLEKDVTYRAVLSGDQEIPSVATEARGLATCNLTRVLNTLEVNVLLADFTNTITGAHLHMAPAGQNGGVVIDLSDLIDGHTIQGTVNATDILEALRAGEIYVNVHTDANPGGEIRGQLQLASGISFDGWLAGANEVPAVVTPGQGLMSIGLSADLQSLDVWALTDHTSAEISAAHLHVAPQGDNGSVALNLSGDLDNGAITGTYPVDSALIAALLSGDVYLNMHSAAFPGGELRAQVYGLIRDSYVYDLCPDQETATITNAPSASGGGILSLDRKATNLHLMTVTSGTTGDVQAIHLHNAPFGMDGPVIVNLTGATANGGTFLYFNDSSVDFDETIAIPIRAGNMYVNAHTMANPGGELRGQVSRESLCPPRLRLPEIRVVNPNFGSDVMIATRLSGNQEVPAVSTDALGVATISFDEDYSMATINVSMSNFSEPVTGIHIHEGVTGENGPVIINLTDALGGYRVTSTFPVDTEMRAKLLSGQYYLNAHTATNPGGELRGQLTVEAAESFYSPVLAPEGTAPADRAGMVIAHYTAPTNTLEINFHANGLTGPITGIHLHTGNDTTNGPVIQDLTEYLQGNSLDLKLNPADYIEDLRNGNIYINVHTAENPAGEIRGTLQTADFLVFDSWLTGDQEVPAVNNQSIGLALIGLDYDLSTLHYQVLMSNLTGPANAAHFHGAALGEAGGVILNISDGIGGVWISSQAGGTSVDKSFVDALLSGDTYLNVHTDVFPSGEIRGQAYRLARDGYAYDLCPEQETGNVIAPDATGAGMFAYNRDLDEAHLMVVVNGLTGDPTGAHIHEGASGTDGGVIFPFTDQLINNGAFLYVSANSPVPFTPAFAEVINTGNAYVNVHTSAHPSGELRGQIVKQPECPFTTSTRNGQLVQAPLTTFPNPTNDEVVMQLNDHFSGQLIIEIFSGEGRLISSQRMSAAEYDNTVRISFSTAASGMYLARITSSDAQGFARIVRN